MTQAEFANYIDEHYDHLLAFVQHLLHHQHDAEELLQDKLIDLWIVCDRIEANCARAFIFAALRNACVDYWRRPRLPEEPLRPDVATDKRRRNRPEPSLLEIPHAVDEFVDLLTQKEEMGANRQMAIAAYLKSNGNRTDAMAILPSYDGRKHKAKAALATIPDVGYYLSTLGPARIYQILFQVFCGDNPPEAVSQRGNP